VIPFKRLWLFLAKPNNQQMRKIIICIAIVSFSFEKIYAQKIDLDKELWTHNYVSIPKSNDLTSLRTYSISMFANMENLNRIGLSSDKIETAFNLDGFVYTKGIADILIDVTIENLRKVSEEVVTKESSVYEAGKTIIKKTYTPTTSYTIPTTIKVTKALNREVILNTTIGGSENPIVIELGQLSTFEAATAQLKGSGDKRLDSFKEKYNQLLTAELKRFKEKYDFIISKETEVFWHVDLKKNPEFSEFNEKLAIAKDVFAKQKISDEIKVTREKLIGVMQYFRENADKISSEDKKTRKLKYAYLINLAKMQLWLEMVDECGLSAQQIIDNDYDKMDGKVLLRAADLLKEDLKRSPNGSRNLIRDGFTSSIRFSASEVQPIPFKLPTPPAGFKSYSGIMTTITGEQNKGALWAKATGPISFEPQSETRFIYEKNNELKEQLIDLNEIEKIVLEDGEKFERLKHKDNYMFFQVLHESNNFKILKYYRSNEGEDATMGIAELNNGKEMCIMKNSSGAIKSVGAGLGGNAAKKTAEFYSTCEPLKAKILANEFGKMSELDAQIKALTFFEQECK
jgi:hypothetical protein